MASLGGILRWPVARAAAPNRRRSGATAPNPEITYHNYCELRA
ncbi:MAG TPA: hypothetical protein PK098_04205 [Phycisphaerales bacterium]|nr:hypothetical protein [Phycisphaerales bacterium]